MIDHILYRIRNFALSFKRSSAWSSLERKFVLKNGSCAACGTDKKLQVHHIMPFHVYPELELEESNLITLCMAENRCHFWVGHGGSWRAYNPDVRTHARKILHKDCDRQILLEKIKKSRVIC